MGKLPGAHRCGFDSYLTLRGLRTLSARLEHHGRNAGRLAEWLQSQPGVNRVFYPGLPDHPGHHIAARQQQGFGAIVTLELAGGHDAVRALVSQMQYFSLAESLGGVESLVAHPATMTHAAMDPQARQRAGLTDGLLRLSVGIEAFATCAMISQPASNARAPRRLKGSSGPHRRPRAC